VFGQTYKNWELLLVDDGSTDDSTTIARNYAENYPEKVRYLEHEGHQNRGASAARNLGVHNARGEFIAFLDADDVFLPYKLEQQIPILVSHTEAAMLYGSSYYWYSWTGDPDDIQRDYEIEIINAQLNKPLIEEAFRDLFDDQVFIAKMSLEAPIVLVPGVFEKYRQHQDSCTYISEKITGEGLKVRPTYLNWLEGYLADLEIKDAKLWRALRKEQLLHRHAILKHIIYYFKRISVPMNKWAGKMARKILPASVRHWLWIHWHHKLWPPVGWVRIGSLRRVTPISQVFGFDRGQPIDRYYIER
jgi:glycosyltransferase involved in cell wall biosynthesis